MVCKLLVMWTELFPDLAPKPRLRSLIGPYSSLGKTRAG